MRSFLLALSLAMAVPAVTTAPALADAHSCSQLRQNVIGRMPASLHNRPWALLSCAGVAELHALVNLRHSNNSRLMQRVDAVFRGEGLIR